MGRCDGTRIKNETPMYYLIPHFLTKRYDAQNMITLYIPEEPLREYKNKLRKEGKRVSHLSLIVCAYMQTCTKFPSLNRFIVNRRIYQHNDFTVSMVVLRPGEDNDTMSKIYLEPSDTIFDVEEKVTNYVDENRKDNNANSLDKVMDVLCRMNGLMRVAIDLFRFADNHNFLPKGIVKASPFHASVLVSNLASIRTNHIYHHVYQFGTTSVGITIGNMREMPKRGKNGEVELERCIPLGVVMDERICNGHYCANAFHYMSDLLAHPEKMELNVADQEKKD